VRSTIKMEDEVENQAMKVKTGKLPKGIKVK
jgi:hypothetical protein